MSTVIAVSRRSASSAYVTTRGQKQQVVGFFQRKSLYFCCYRFWDLKLVMPLCTYTEHIKLYLRPWQTMSPPKICPSTAEDTFAHLLSPKDNQQ